MKKILLGSLAAAVLAITLAACGGGGNGGGGTGTAMPGIAACTAQAGSGVVCGKALAADGVTPLAGAEVRLANASAMTLGTLSTKGVEDPTKCVADQAGNFACVVPAGTTGNVNFLLIFTGFDNKSFTANIVTDQTTDVGNLTMVASSTAKWVVVPGSFDGVQVLLSQLKGCTLTNGSGDPFDPATMDPASARGSTDCENKGLLVLSEDSSSPYYPPTFLASSDFTGYAALFINCDANYSDSGGAVDTALQNFSNNGGHIYFSDLADSWLTAVFPDKITFGSHSTSSGTVSGEVIHPGLAAVVGNPINIIFDLGAWADIDTVASGVETFIQGDISALSSLAGVHPITVGWRPSSSSGCVFFTSYHIEGAGTGTNAPQEVAIKYLVQNIATVCR
jgi:hypothetical protein